MAKKKSKARYPHSARGLLPTDSYRDLLLIKQRTGKSYSSLVREGVRMVVDLYKQNGVI